MAEIRHLENWHVVFSAEDGPIWIKFHTDWCRMTCLLRWCVEMETRCRIPVWRTFERIQWHVIPEPRITLQGAAIWWIHCDDYKATCHIAGCSHLAKSMSWSSHISACKNSIRHIDDRFLPYFILFFKMQFGLWRAAAFVSSQTHLLFFWKSRSKINRFQ